jgi:two-component system LytT family response regulator
MSAVHDASVPWPGYAEAPAAPRRDERPARRAEGGSDLRRTRYADCIPVRSLDRIVIVRVESIARLEADDNYVRIWADRMYLHKETLAGLCARLDPLQFLRIHRSHAVRIDCVRELVPRLHGEYLLRLDSGVQLISGRSYRAAIRAAFGLE